MLKLETQKDESVDVEVQVKSVGHISDSTLLDLFDYLIQEEGYNIEELTAIMEYLFKKESKADAE